MVWAHRGGAHEGPENTIPTMLAAIRRDPQVIIEIDARATRDGQIVVLHDATVDRTTDGSGKIAELDLAAAQSLDAAHCSLARIDENAATNPVPAESDLSTLPLVPGGTARPTACRDAAQSHRFGLRKRGFRIPTLAEVMQALPRSTVIAIEVKTRGFEAELARLLLDSGRGGYLVVGSGHDDVGTKLRGLLPPGFAAHYFPKWAAMRLAVGTRLAGGKISWPEFQILASPKRVAGISLSGAGFISDLHRQGLWAMYFIIDDEAEMERLFNAGADAIITDLPTLAARVRDRVRPTEARSQR
jgi:glycerophosphoryl diester phosphodiesterase